MASSASISFSSFQALSSLDSCYEGAALTVGAKEEVLAFTAFPTEHWRQIWSTNPLERIEAAMPGVGGMTT